jgi:hypothetical protein
MLQQLSQGGVHGTGGFERNGGFSTTDKQLRFRIADNGKLLVLCNARKIFVMTHAAEIVSG